MSPSFLNIRKYAIRALLAVGAVLGISACGTAKQPSVDSSSNNPTTSSNPSKPTDNSGNFDTREKLYGPPVIRQRPIIVNEPVYGAPLPPEKLKSK